MDQLKELRAAWSENLFQSVVPFWLRHSLDHEHGGYFTALDRDGSVYDDTKYMWLNGRALYTFARLYNEFPGHPDRLAWRRAAELGAGFLDKALEPESGLLFFSTTRAGDRLHLQRKPFAAVFYSQGMLQYWRMLNTVQKEEGGIAVAQMKEALTKATGMFEQLLRWIADPTLCGRPVCPPSAHQAGGSNLAEVMCAASLSLDFYHVLVGDPEARAAHLGRIRSCMAGVRRHYDPERRVLMEHAGPGGVDLSTPGGRLLNPGHSIEVAWFLLEMCQVSGLALLVLTMLSGEPRPRARGNGVRGMLRPAVAHMVPGAGGQPGNRLGRSIWRWATVHARRIG